MSSHGAGPRWSANAMAQLLTFLIAVAGEVARFNTNKAR
jgi:hypothetical protein